MLAAYQNEMNSMKAVKFCVLGIFFLLSPVQAMDPPKGDPYWTLKAFIPSEIDGYRLVNLEKYEDDKFGSIATIERRSDGHVERLSIFLFDLGDRSITRSSIEKVFALGVKDIRQMTYEDFASDGYYEISEKIKECENPIFVASARHRIEGKLDSEDVLMVAQSNENYYKARFTSVGVASDDFSSKYRFKDPLGLMVTFLVNMGRC